MLTRRRFLGKSLAGLAADVATASGGAFAAGRLAWTKPIGLEIYTVRDMFAKDPAKTLKEVAAAGYQEVEIGPGVKPSELKQELKAAGLNAPSGYFNSPKTLDEWKQSVEQAHNYGLRYIVVGDNPRLNADEWKKRADLYNECGNVARGEGMQFCYHAHFLELAEVDGTSGYDILLSRCDPKLLKMEMDIFWVTYAGKDPLPYWKRYPGRFPLLHIKDMRKGVSISPQEYPPENGPNPFAPVGRGTIDWSKIFAHVHEAGAQHIFVEQDRCNLPPLEAIKISYEYLRGLRLS
ncbi:MAG: sugar phosphate isomerase/epimerase [Acidobacteria bacterium]|nr:sugar phosphate isomerase/epimerase [Acidobacteriota bacterium]